MTRLPGAVPDDPVVSSLIYGAMAKAAAALGIADVGHRSGCPDPARFALLADIVFDQVEANWRGADAGNNVARSRANWRWWKPQSFISAHNRSPEVVLERAIAGAAVRQDNRTWANQVPVSSGLTTGSGERRRAIDLVERRGDRHFAFIELKIASDTPLFAAIEVLGYAAIWLLYRESGHQSESPLLLADRIDLRVLAPRAYYRMNDVDALESAVASAVTRRGRTRGVALSFRLDVLDDRLAAGAILEDATLLGLLANPQPLHGRAIFMPGVPEDRVRAALDNAGGNEIASGKFASPQSSAALAVNGFGWFLDRPADLPPFPGLDDLDWPARRVDVERQMRFPWSGGHHPWLDAGVETDRHLIGVESKRFEPFRDTKAAQFSDAYDRDMWNDGMAPFAAMRDRLRLNPAAFRHLDAAQLVKHSLGVATEARRTGKIPVLLYIYAEPRNQAPEAIAQHRAEIAAFEHAVSGGRVRFAACRWGDWLDRFDGPAAGHAARLIDAFGP